MLQNGLWLLEQRARASEGDTCGYDQQTQETEPHICHAQVVAFARERSGIAGKWGPEQVAFERPETRIEAPSAIVATRLAASSAGRGLCCWQRSLLRTEVSAAGRGLCSYRGLCC
jgi:hypothetical protein